MGIIHISDEQYQNMAFGWGMHYDLENKVIYGRRKGYPFLLYISNTSAPLMFTIITSAKSETCPQIGKAEKKMLRDRAPMLQLVGQRDSKITALCANILDFNDAKRVVDGILSVLVSFMKEKGFVPCCENCKCSEPAQILQTGVEYRHLCDRCGEIIAAQSRQELSSDQAVRKNGITGILCALLGAVMGIVFMIFLTVNIGNLLTFIATGILLGTSTVGLGMCLGGRPGTAVKITVAMILVLAVFVGYNASYITSFVVSRGMSVGSAFATYTINMLKGRANMQVWVGRLVILYIGAAVGGIISYRSASKKFGSSCKIVYIGGHDNDQMRSL